MTTQAAPTLTSAALEFTIATKMLFAPTRTDRLSEFPNRKRRTIPKINFLSVANVKRDFSAMEKSNAIEPALRRVITDDAQTIPTISAPAILAGPAATAH